MRGRERPKNTAVAGERGIALAEVCVAALLLGLVTSMAFHFIARSQTTHSTLRLTEVRAQLQLMLFAAARNPSIIMHSSNFDPVKNARLATCIDAVESAVVDCDATESTAVASGSQVTRMKYPLALFDTVTNGPISGTEAAPVLYSLEGVRCATASPRCPFQVVTWFRASCLANASACAAAEFISVFYRIRLDPAYGNAGGGFALRTATNSPVAANATLLGSTFEISESHSVNQILTSSGIPELVRCRGSCAGRYGRTLGRFPALSPLGHFTGLPSCPIASPPGPPLVSLCAMEQ